MNRHTVSVHNDVDFITMKADEFYAWLERNNQLAIEQEKKRESQPKPIVFTKPENAHRVPFRKKAVKEKSVKPPKPAKKAKEKKPEKVKAERKPVKRAKVGDAGIEMGKLVGMRFGKLTVAEICTVGRRGCTLKCKCDCGGERIVTRYDLLNGWVKSCGCLKHRGDANNKNLYNWRQRLMKAGYVVDVKNAKVWYSSATARSEELENRFPGIYQFAETDEK